MNQLENKIALITGSAHTIGKAIALGMAREGAHIVIADRDVEAMEATEKEIQALGVQTLAVSTDFLEDKQILNLFEKIMEKFGRLDILVNNAGIFGGGPIDQISTETWDNVIGTSLRSAFLCTRSAFAIMKEQGGGRIINMGSISAQRVRTYNAPYSAGKFGLVGLTQTTALEGRDYGITCGILHPGEVTRDRPFVPPPGFKPPPGPRPDAPPAMTADEIAAAAIFMASAPPHVNVLELIQLHTEQLYLGRG
ncbi:SDR family NAD(P)-dependent oxidoreductase [Chloroflexota bacterium]